jgi:hypothetical protein
MLPFVACAKFYIILFFEGTMKYFGHDVQANVIK